MLINLEYVWLLATLFKDIQFTIYLFIYLFIYFFGFLSPLNFGRSHYIIFHRIKLNSYTSSLFYHGCGLTRNLTFNGSMLLTDTAFLPVCLVLRMQGSYCQELKTFIAIIFYFCSYLVFHIQTLIAQGSMSKYISTSFIKDVGHQIHLQVK